MLSLSLPLLLLILLPRFALSFSSSRISSPSLFLPHPLIVIALAGPGTPFDAPEGPLPLFTPRCPLATSPRPVAWPLACLETLFQPQVPTCIKPLQPAPSITTLHITHYKLPVSLMDYQSRPSSLMPPSILSPSTLPRTVSRIFGHAQNRQIFSNINVSPNLHRRCLHVKRKCDQIIGCTHNISSDRLPSRRGG